MKQRIIFISKILAILSFIYLFWDNLQQSFSSNNYLKTIAIFIVLALFIMYLLFTLFEKK